MSFKFHITQVGIGVDQTLNAMLGGYADETLSARAWRLHEKYWYANAWRVIIDSIFRLFGQKEHCKNAYLSECNRVHLPKEYIKGDCK